MASTVVVTEKEYRKAEHVFREAAGLRCVAAPPDEDRLAATIRASDARHAIVGVTPYRDGLYNALPRGGVLARFGVGHDGIDKTKASAAGLLVTNTPGVLDQSVAEHTMLLMLAAARGFEAAVAAARGGDWSLPAGTELSGRRLAVIGLGRIGRAVGRIAGLGFGMRVRGCLRQRGSDTPLPDGFHSVTDDFAGAVADTDFVSIHLPARPDTARFINAERLAAMPRTAWLINTARGSIVDEGALYHALAAGKLAGAALDVYDHEPYRPGSADCDLRRLGNVVLTPHIGSNTAEANRRMAERALRNIQAAESGNLNGMDLVNAVLI
jgi:phosphoglycerate dehydrogenase-like enzyme